MTESYSLWQMGRDVAGRFSSMVPHQCPQSASLDLGMVAPAMSAVTAVAQFGIWYELHQMNRLAAAQFEERRIQWLNGIVDQWIDEHRDKSGLEVDVTLAMAREAEKLLGKLTEDDVMDVPQALLLKVSRVSDYLDELCATWCTVQQRLVEASGSDEVWLANSMSSRAIAEHLLYVEEPEEEGSSVVEWAVGALGVAALFVPVVGPAFGGGVLGGLIGGKVGAWFDPDPMDRLREYEELYRFPIAVERVLGIVGGVEAFLERQVLDHGSHLYVVGDGAGARLLLGPDRAPSFMTRLSGHVRPQLRALPAPEAA